MAHQMARRTPSGGKSGCWAGSVSRWRNRLAWKRRGSRGTREKNVCTLKMRSASGRFRCQDHKLWTRVGAGREGCHPGQRRSWSPRESFTSHSGPWSRPPSPSAWWAGGCVASRIAERSIAEKSPLTSPPPPVLYSLPASPLTLNCSRPVLIRII